MPKSKSGKPNFLHRVFNKYFQFVDFVASVLEVHLTKIMAFVIMALCCDMVSAMHLIVVVVMTFCLLFGFSALSFSFSFIAIFLSLIFLLQMTYQTKLIPPLEFGLECADSIYIFLNLIKSTILDPNWWGFKKLKTAEELISHSKSYIMFFFTMTFVTMVKARQRIIRIDEGKPHEIPRVVYQNIKREDADKNLKLCLKFLLNYGFYKFGIEITLSFCVFVIAYRLDVFSVVYAIWVLILVQPKRQNLAILWPVFLTTIAFSVLWQYTMVVGLSKSTCFEYPWVHQESLIPWLFLPNFKQKLDTNKIFVDFILLILAQRQQSVFELERKFGDRYSGGSNKEVYMHYTNRHFSNPTPDHTGSIRSWLDFAKFLFMSCLFRVTLAFLFWNGASNVTFLSLGYLVGAFVFLWIDYDLCLWRVEKILKWWNTLLEYIVFVILLKSLLEFAGCIYGNFLKKNAFWLVDMLSLDCKSSMNQQQNSFYWDVVCFILVIFQKRIQAKGAKLMDELHDVKISKFQKRETKTLMKIKSNMNRIKAWQKRMQGLNYKEPTDHATAIFMGDYFMFEDLEETSSTMEDSSSSSDEDMYDEIGKRKKRSVTMTEFIGSVLKRGAEDSKRSRRRRPAFAEDNRKPSEMGEDHQTDKEKRRSEAPNVKFDVDDGQKSDDNSDIKKDKFKKGWKLFLSFLASVLVSLIQFFNKYSKDYLFIQSLMKEERKKYKSRIRKESVDEKDSSPREKADDLKRFSTASNDLRDSETDDENKKSFQGLLVELINAISMFVMSKTELLCYVIIFIHTVLSPTMISLPLPLFVFFWGSLTSVRPTSTFWTVLIAYTEVTVVIKAIFQNSIFPWNQYDKKTTTVRPDYPPQFFGIHRHNQYVIADLFLLLLLFLHRYKLKTLGLWNRTHEEETKPPQNLKLYKELMTESEMKQMRRHRGSLRRRRLTSDSLNRQESLSKYYQMAAWKCTSRATAKLTHVKDEVKTTIKIKEIEGTILVTHDGRRLQPTNILVTQLPDEELEGNVVLRVYVGDVVTEPRNLVFRLSWIQHFTSLRKFFIQIVVRDWRLATDYYTLMFFFEFIDFLIVFFGYNSFTSSIDEAADDYFSFIKNQIPPMHLFTMVSHFSVIIIDRVLYLRKNIIGKLILQIALVIMVHIWMFFVIPIASESSFSALPVAQSYYMISCFYFLMSAYQLRVGYPLRVQGHFLSRKYGFVNYYAYRGLQLIPFFNQLRTVLDYMCTHSSLTMMEWITLESIFQLVYVNKCSRRIDIHYPSARGEECPKTSKYISSVLVLLAMIIVIWLPFLVFVVFNTVAEPNLPQEGILELHIASFGVIYFSRAELSDVHSFTGSQFSLLESIYKKNKKVWSFLSMYDDRDVGVLAFRFDPHRPWIITPQELNEMNITIQNTDIPIVAYLTWTIQRSPRPQVKDLAKGSEEITLGPDSEERRQMADAFLEKGTKIRLENLLPKFLHVTNEGEAKPLAGFLKNRNNPYRNATLSLQQNGTIRWWRLEELFDSDDQELKKLPQYNENFIMIYTINDKNIPQFFSSISRRGIIGLYISIVLVMWTFFRRLMAKYPTVMFDAMPNPDPVLKLCHDIYLARESQEFALEEDLYAKLLFLFRSPETMIKVTRLNTGALP